MTGLLIGPMTAGVAVAGCACVGVRGLLRWAQRRCAGALADAHTYPSPSSPEGRPTVFLARAGGQGGRGGPHLGRAGARRLAAFQQALDEERRAGRLFAQPAVPATGYLRDERYRNRG